MLNRGKFYLLIDQENTIQKKKLASSATVCPTGSSTLIKTASTGELEERIAATTGAITVASTSADVAVSSAVTTYRQPPEEQQVQAMNIRKSILESATSKEALSLHQANLQSTRRRPRKAEQIERTKELAVVTHRGIGYYFTCAHLVTEKYFV